MKKKWEKRFLSLFLAGIMMVSSVITGYAAEVNPGYSKTITDGEIVAQSYDGFSAEEKAIMSNSGVSDAMTFIAPSDSALVTVDPDNKTVTAANYNEDGNAWKAVAAYVVEGNTETLIPNFAEGTGNFVGIPNTESYSIKVKYQLSKSIDEATQRKLMNTPYHLVTAVKHFEKMADKKDALNALTVTDSVYEEVGYSNIAKLLKGFYDGITYVVGSFPFKIQVQDEKTRSAIEQLLVDTDNGNKPIAILADIEDYITNYRENAKQTYVMVSGEETAAKAKATYDYLNEICVGYGFMQVEDNLKLLKDSGVQEAATALLALGTLKTNIAAARDAIGATIQEDVSEAQGLMKNPSDVTMTTLIDLALANPSSVGLNNDVNINKTDLVVAETYIISNVNRHDVTVTVKANAISKSSVDSDELSALDSFTATLQINDNASYDDLMEAIAEAGVEADALTAWSEYEVNETNYVRTTTQLSNVTGDMNFEIVYNPIKVTLTEVDESANTNVSADVYYGYNKSLAKHANSEKSYDYAIDDSGFIYQEGHIQRITKDTTITRREGKAKVTDRLLGVLAMDANYGFSNAAKAILESAAVKSDMVAFRAPDDNDAASLITMAASNQSGVDVYIVTAASYESGVDGMTWQPISCDVYDDNNALKATYPIASAVFATEDVSKVIVKYELKITKRDNSDTAGISDAEVLEYANIPDTLVSEAKEQIATMNKLVGQLNNLNMGSKIHFLLGGLSADETVSADAKTAIGNLLGSGFNADKSLKLYGYVSDYANGDLSDYYKAVGGYADIKSQVDLLINNLPAILDEQAFIDLVYSENPEYIEKLDSVMGILTSLTFTAPNAYIDLNAGTSAVAELMSLLESANLADYTKYTASKGLTAAANVSKTAEGRVSLVLKLDVYDSTGAVAKSYTSDSITYGKNYELKDSDITNLQGMLYTLLANVNQKYYKETAAIVLPSVGDSIAANTTLTATWAPKTYTVNLQDEGASAVKLAEITVDNNVITLEAAPAGYKYVYSIGGETIEVTTEAKDFVFTTAKIDAYFGAGTTLTITRAKSNISIEDVKGFVTDLNNALASSGIAGTKTYLLQNEDNENQLAMVMRMTLSDLKSQAANVLKAFGMTIIGESYVGMNGQAFYDGSSLYLQTLIDAILASGTGMDTLKNVINDNGTVKQFTLEDYQVVAGQGKARAGETLGGVIMEITLQMAVDGGSVLDIPLYITLDDLGIADDAATLKNVKSLIQKAQPWIDVETGLETGAPANTGRLHATINDASASEKIFEMMITGTLLLGDYNSLADITDIEMKALIDYVKAKLEPVIDDTRLTYQTIENTLDMAGVSYDLSAYEVTIDKALNLIRSLENYATITVENAAEDYLYNFTVSIEKDTLLSKLNLEPVIANAIKDEKIDIRVTLESADIRDNKYEALILDNGKSGLNKFDMVYDAAAGIAAAGNNAIVVLLDDVTGDVTVKSGIILDLNGKTINGNIINNSANVVRIIDNDVTQGGKVTGGLNGSGAYKVSAGTYGTISADQLAGGYIIEGNTVKNVVYTLSENANGDITVLLNAAFIETAKDTEIKDFALDLGVKLALNYFTWAALAVDGDVIYDITVDDAIEVINSSKGDLINDIIDLVKVNGVKNFANKVIVDLTDFAAIAAAIESNTAIATYPIATNPWDVKIAIKNDGSKDYLAAGIGSNASSTYNNTISIFATGTDAQKASAAAVLKEIDKVVTEKTIMIDTLTDISYVDGSIATDIHGTAKVTVDLRGDERYTTIIGTILASGGVVSVDAVNAWVKDRDCTKLKREVEALTVAKVISTLRAAQGVSFNSMLSKITFTDDNVKAQVAALESIYHPYLNAVYALMNRFDIDGGSQKLPQTSEFGVYGIEKTNWHRMDLALTLKLFKEFVAEPTIKVSVKNTNNVFCGWYVNETEKLIYIDLQNTNATIGVTGDEFWNALECTILVGTYKYHEYDKLSDGLVATGTKLTITAQNGNKFANESYTIIVLGDVNCNGKLEVADASLIRRQLIGLETLDALPLEALDVNYNDEEEVADASAVHRRLIGLDINGDDTDDVVTFLPYKKQ